MAQNTTTIPSKSRGQIYNWDNYPNPIPN